jgi:hypothetical protein
MKSDVINYLKDCRYVQVSTTILERKPKQTMKKTTSGRSKKQELKKNANWKNKIAMVITVDTDYQASRSSFPLFPPPTDH